MPDSAALRTTAIEIARGLTAKLRGPERDRWEVRRDPGDPGRVEISAKPGNDRGLPWQTPRRTVVITRRELPGGDAAYSVTAAEGTRTIGHAASDDPAAGAAPGTHGAPLRSLMDARALESLWTVADVLAEPVERENPDGAAGRFLGD